jgi:hypothetical protein
MPWREAVECESLDTLQTMMWMDLSACTPSKSSLPATALAMASPKELEKITPIDPEPLLEELAQQDQPPPPPPIPQLQQQQQPPPPPPPPAPPPPRRPMQVVETKPNNDKEPDNARFLAENKSVAEKQRVSRGSVKEPMVAKSKPDELTVKDKPAGVLLTRRRNGFSERDRSLFASLASQLSMGMENARLYHQLAGVWLRMCAGLTLIALAIMQPLVHAWVGDEAGDATTTDPCARHTRTVAGAATYKPRARSP